MSDDNNDESGGDDDILDDDTPELELLLAELNAIALAGNFDVEEAVSRSKARNVLEATAGDVLTAAQLYWDDFLATRLQGQNDAMPPEHAAAAQPQAAVSTRRGETRRVPSKRHEDGTFWKRLQADESQSLDEEDGADKPEWEVDDADAEAEAAPDPDNDEGAAAAASDAENAEEVDPEMKSLRRRLFATNKPRRAELRRKAKDKIKVQIKVKRNNKAAAADGNAESDGEQDDETQHRIVNVGDDSVSVSDDEAILRGRSRRLLQRLKRKREDELSSSKRRKLLFGKFIQEDANEEDDAYLSENDWLCDSLTSRDSIPLSEPIDLLWGYASAAKHKTATGATRDNTIDLTAIEGDAQTDGEQNVVVVSDENPTVIDLQAAEPLKGIPRTWLNAGFHMISTKNDGTTVGFSARPPNENDLAYFCWKHQQDNDSNSHAPIPLPYHCRSVTALLSIVTGLLYTGASLQSGGLISCTSSRTPFLDVISSQGDAAAKRAADKSTKRGGNDDLPLVREFDTRLVDAISSLLFIAAKASIERKQKALQAFKMSTDPADQTKWQKLQRKLKLVPTCWWTRDAAGDVVLPSLGVDGVSTCSIPVATSYTNIDDLRSYVVSNLRSFKASGGCALFLETIIRIHGKGAVARMIRRSRKAAGCGASDMNGPLIRCTCDARHLAKLDANPPLAQKLKMDAKNRIVSATTPEGHDCFSIELLSLILTGQVHSTLQGWSTAPLGLGILSNTPNEVGRGLTRPEKPVWLLRGPTCYSVMWLNGSKDHVATFAKVDHPGSVATLTHWNSWYGERNSTNLRLVVNRAERPTTQTVSDDEDDEDASFEKEISKLTCTMKMLARRRRDDLMAIKDCASVETVPSDLIVTPEELDRVLANPDDQRFYPGKYQMWRYDIGEDPKTASEDRKQHAQVWKPFFSLSRREKLVVESKLGPTICTVLWTRWPRATVDKLVPERPPPSV